MIDFLEAYFIVICNCLLSTSWLASVTFTFFSLACKKIHGSIQKSGVDLDVVIGQMRILDG